MVNAVSYTLVNSFIVLDRNKGCFKRVNNTIDYCRELNLRDLRYINIS